LNIAFLKFFFVCRRATSPRKITELEEKIAILKHELSEVYRTHGANAQKLLDLNEKLKKHEATLVLKEQE
jgi:hypothetical protein